MTHVTVSLAVQHYKHIQTPSMTPPPHTHPCCFQNVRSAWAVLIVLIVMNFFCTYNNDYCDIIVIAIVLINAFTLSPFLHISEREQITIYFSIYGITFPRSENSITITIIKSSISDKDDHLWLDECILICV